MANSDKPTIEAQTQALRGARHWQVSVFAEPPFLGNAAMIYLLERPACYASMGAVAGQSNASASCFLWPDTHNKYHVRCFNDAGPIQCCGHGLLAAAYVLHQAMNVRAASGLIQLYLSDDEFCTVSQSDGNLWLRLPRLDCVASAIPNWIREAFWPPPTLAATAGGTQGYWVLEYDAEVRLAEVMIDYQMIRQNTRRAVIITQSGLIKRISSSLCDSSYDFYLRYFAPQYGVDEDPVTGSAQRVLADYWGRKTGAGKFRALQCSPGGGVVSMQLQPDHVAITGHIKIIDAYEI